MHKDLNSTHWLRENPYTFINHNNYIWSHLKCHCSRLKTIYELKKILHRWLNITCLKKFVVVGWTSGIYVLWCPPPSVSWMISWGGPSKLGERVSEVCVCRHVCIYSIIRVMTYIITSGQLAAKHHMLIAWRHASFPCRHTCKHTS